MDIADQSYPGHHSEQIICDVDFPPADSLSAAERIMMMIVVPAFSESE